MKPLEFDEREVRKNYRALGHGQRDEWKTNVVAFDEGGLAGSATVRSEDDFVDFCRKYAGNADIYAGANPIAGEPAKGKLREEDIEAVTVIPLDFDAIREKCPFCGEIKKITGKCGGCGNKIPATEEELERCVESVEEFLDEFWGEKPPYGITGNGVQPLLSIPPIDLDEYPEISEKISEFQDRVKEAAKNFSHLDFDKTGIARVVRVWGTQNVSAEEAENRPLRMAESIQPERRESKDLRDYILDLEARRASPTPDSIELGEFSEEAREEFTESLRSSLSFNKTLWKLWNGNFSEVSEDLVDDRSKREAIFAMKIVEEMGDIGNSPASVVAHAMEEWPYSEKWEENEFHRKSAVEWALRNAKSIGTRDFIELESVGAKFDLKKEVDEDTGDTYYELGPFGLEKGMTFEDKRDLGKDSLKETLEEKFSEWWDVEGLEAENLALKAMMGVREELRRREIDSWIQVSDGILEDFHFVTGIDNHKTRVYEGGVYVDQGEEKIAQEVERRMGAPKREKINEIEARIVRNTYTPRDEYENPPHLINVKNGFLDPTEGELRDHTPDHISLSQLPVEHDPEADCSEIKENIIGEIVPERFIPVIQEFFGYCLLKDYPIAKFPILVGVGANGKGTLLRLLRKFLGKENVSSATLRQISRGKFASSDLYGSLANICGDVSKGTIKNVGFLKEATGRDLLRGEEKYEKAFQFENSAKLVFAANELPDFSEDTHALWRRLMIIDTPYTFKENPDPDEPMEKKKDPKILEKVVTEEELSGLLNWSLKGLERLLDRGEFSYDKSESHTRKDYIRRSNSAKAFVEEMIEPSEDDLPKEEAYQSYRDFCEEIGVEPGKKSGFVRDAKEAGLTDSRPTIDGKRVRVFDKVQIRGEASEKKLKSILDNLDTPDELIKDVQDVQDVQGRLQDFFERTPELAKEIDIAEEKILTFIEVLAEDQPAGPNELKKRYVEKGAGGEEAYQAVEILAQGKELGMFQEEDGEFAFRFCDECLKNFGIKHPALLKVDVHGEERWMCKKCLRVLVGK